MDSVTEIPVAPIRASGSLTGGTVTSEPAAPPVVPARAQALKDWHACNTEAERKAVVEKYKNVPGADLRTIFMIPASYGVV